MFSFLGNVREHSSVLTRAKSYTGFELLSLTPRIKANFLFSSQAPDVTLSRRFVCLVLTMDALRWDGGL